MLAGKSRAAKSAPKICKNDIDTFSPVQIKGRPMVDTPRVFINKTPLLPKPAPMGKESGAELAGKMPACPDRFATANPSCGGLEAYPPLQL
jgi:hypothetical protein